MDLPVVWFLLIAVLWTGYLVLEGFDFGVGMLLAILPRGDKLRREKERRLMINTIGPVWDGNEVWLLTAGGATFAAFPEWYATLFSGFYLPLFLILIALIVRVVAFEWRGKIDSPQWRTWADRALIFGSFVPALLWGVAFANLVRGVELDANHQYVGGFFALLSPFALLGGVVTLSIFLTHGAIFLAMKTDGEMRERAGTFAARSSVVTLLAAGVWAVWAQVAYSGEAWTWAAVLVAAVALVLVVVATRQRREALAFGASVVTIVAAVVLIFGSMFPDVMPAFDPANSLTVENASSTDYTLTVMTWVAVILTPIVLLYQGWTYWVFRKRLTIEHIPEATGLTFERVVSRS
ncbi:cytochrome d ubiquinol oxidase subunit II [Cellulomonas sp. zg-ZUI199]|uniref:Cytochrome d ubiquinol oxidase subunit II n=1 Tax=Cellulomonas wangleii TaxID=2816956 RepID=A0ABX8D110_9CELL|nr:MULTISPECIES: cytochrome d ubiquinol oxidase subunit II [Cellulomonas]MBO0899937.1 cytochrome d ubiquinol oxidase subunit II [Cellulomonas sp. zg-ZUI22]MBO0925370.1 cytochrome d ubiquinol oxidase subunit II [Cellulomonas wangleii]QVI61140.1 cytochrome d ubiquinol oxidase subunit II [Cellulomonas wangleii]